MATATTPDPGPVLPPDFDTLLGDLSPDAFKDTPLWMVSDVVGTVLDLYAGGRVSPDEAERALAALIVSADDGSQWSLGATTRRWFRKEDGGAWALAKPPTDPGALLKPAQEAVRAGLWALGVDPATVDLAATPKPTRESAEDLLDDLIEDYSDED